MHDPVAAKAPGDAPRGIVIVAHGSRAPETARELRRLAELVERRTTDQVVVRGAFLEHAGPTVAEAIADAVEGCRCERVHLVPLLLNRGYHATVDIPEVLAEAQERFPDVTLTVGEVIGVDPRVRALLIDRILHKHRPGPTDGMVIATTATADEASRTALEAAAAEVALRCNMSVARHAIAWAGLDETGVPEAIERVVAAGADQIGVVSLSFLAGRIVAACEQDVYDVRERHPGIFIRWCGRLGPDPIIADMIAVRGIIGE